jgi:hypothetical protein
MSAPFGFFETIVRDLGGKGHLRLIIQPTIAIVLGIRLGLADANEGREPFVARLFHTREHRVRNAFSDVIVPMCVAIVVDAILQHYTLDHVRPLAAFVVALLLVWIPFALARAITNRIARGHVPARPAA